MGLSDLGVWLLGRFPAFWRFIQSIPKLNAWVNEFAINALVNSTAARPYPFSLWSPDQTQAVDRYVSWTSLVDRTFTGRHLPPAEASDIDKLPPPGQVVELFRRQQTNGEEKVDKCERTSALFCFFAQWFTDSFLRTNFTDRRKNTSNHEIDLCQIYGLDAATAGILRVGQGGLLRAESGLFPERLYQGGRIKGHFGPLPYIGMNPNDPTGKNDFEPMMKDVFSKAIKEPARRDRLYATGLERGNSTILYTAVSSVFVREHNRICGELRRRHPKWTDDRLFETARNVNTVLLLRIIVEEYINHLAGTNFKFSLQRGFAERQRWYRTNRIALEFNLLYRWHSLVPNTLVIDKQTLVGEDFRFNNQVLEDRGAEFIIDQASRQSAGRIGLGNTPHFLIKAEEAALNMARTFRLQSYNDYRQCFGMQRYESYDELTGDTTLSAKLRALYGEDVNKLELIVGLLAERRSKGVVLPSLMRNMVGVDAFSQALTNPLLSGNIYGVDAFSEVGQEIIEGTRRFKDVVERNRAPGSRGSWVSFDVTEIPKNERLDSTAAA
jgi:prostaglandin-endoperoxide synthase 2